MSGFTKLVPEIVESSIWNESPEVRCVWVAMLAKKDKDGYVRGDAKTLARIANVGVEHVEEALRKFQDADESSHTPDNEGRRIAAAPGGWVVLNHEIYRARDEKAEHSEYMRNWRKVRKSVNITDSPVNHSEVHVKKSKSHIFHPSVSVSVSGSGRERDAREREPVELGPDADNPHFGADPVYDLLIAGRAVMALVSFENYRQIVKSYPNADARRAVETALAAAEGRQIATPGGAFSWLRKRFQDDETRVDLGKAPRKSRGMTDAEIMAQVM